MTQSVLPLWDRHRSRTPHFSSGEVFEIHARARFSFLRAGRQTHRPIAKTECLRIRMSRLLKGERFSGTVKASVARGAIGNRSLTFVGGRRFTKQLSGCQSL